MTARLPLVLRCENPSVGVRSCADHGSPRTGGGRDPPGPHAAQRRPRVGPGSGLTRPGPGPRSTLTARGRGDSLCNGFTGLAWLISSGARCFEKIFSFPHSRSHFSVHMRQPPPAHPTTKNVCDTPIADAYVMRVAPSRRHTQGTKTFHSVYAKPGAGKNETRPAQQRYTICVVGPDIVSRINRKRRGPIVVCQDVVEVKQSFLL